MTIAPPEFELIDLTEFEQEFGEEELYELRAYGGVTVMARTRGCIDRGISFIITVPGRPATVIRVSDKHSWTICSNVHVNKGDTLNCKSGGFCGCVRH